MQGFTYIDLIILVVYLAAVLFAGLHFAIYLRNIAEPDFIFIISR